MTQGTAYPSLGPKSTLASRLSEYTTDDILAMSYPGAVSPSICTAQVDRTSSTTLTNVTGCSAPLVAGGKYIFEARITGTATANGGAKAAIAGDGTMTATNFSATASNCNGTTANARTTTTTLGNAIGAATAVMTDIIILGALTVNVGGTLNLQIAQNVSHADTTSAYVNSYLKVTRVA